MDAIFIFQLGVHFDLKTTSGQIYALSRERPTESEREKVRKNQIEISKKERTVRKHVNGV